MQYNSSYQMLKKFNDIWFNIEYQMCSVFYLCLQTAAESPTHLIVYMITAKKTLFLWSSILWDKILHLLSYGQLALIWFGSRDSLSLTRCVCTHSFNSNFTFSLPEASCHVVSVKCMLILSNYSMLWGASIYKVWYKWLNSLLNLLFYALHSVSTAFFSQNVSAF